MPRQPRYTAEHTPRPRDPGGTGVRGNPGEGRTVGDAVSRLAGQGSRLAAGMQREERAEFERQHRKAQAAADSAWVSKHVATAKRDWLQKYNDDTQRAERGAPNFAQNFTTEYDEFVAKFLESAPTDTARGMAAQDLDSFGIRMADKSMQFEAKARADAHRADLMDAVNAHANRVISNPGEYQDALEDALTGLATARTFLTAEEVAATKTTIERTLTEAMVRGGIEKNPVAAITLLHSGDLDERLSPNQKESLIRSAQVQIDRREAKAKAAARAAVADLRTEVNTAIDLINNGIEPDTLPALRSQLEALQGAEGAADLSQALSEALRDRDKVQRFRTIPPAGQQQIVSELRHKARTGPLSEEQGRLLIRFEKSMRSTQAGYKSDPWSQGVADGIIDGEPAFNNWMDPVALHARQKKAGALTAHAGEVVPPFSTEELQGLQQVWDQGNADERVALLRALRNGLNDEYLRATAEKIAPSDPTFALTASITGEDPLVARNIVMGQKLVTEKAVVLPTLADTNLAAQEALGDAFNTSPRTRAMVIDAAKAHYAQMAFNKGVTDQADFDMFKESLATVAGGPFKYNGKMILPPVRGMDEENFSKLVSFTRLEDFVRYGSVYDPQTQQFTALRSGQFPQYTNGKFFDIADLEDAELHQVGEGKYMIFIGNGYLAGPENLPFVIDYRTKFKTEWEAAPGVIGNTAVRG